MEVFTKYNDTNFKDALIKEVDGLNLLSLHLKDNEYLNTPKIRSVNKKELQTQLVESSLRTPEFSRALGLGLANLHKIPFEEYGLDYDNYIGLNPQKNILSKNWGEFFYEYRLMYQISLIADIATKRRYETVLLAAKDKLVSFLNDTCSHASLVHGDLWSGNVLYSETGIYLIDPAVYFADREVDIAMSEMFGGFGEEFYKAYDGAYALSGEYQKKRVVFNLYHYLNHFNLFGSGYSFDCNKGFEFIESRL